MMNLSKEIKAKSSATMQVMHPATGVPLDIKGEVMTLTVFGKHSDEFRKAMHKVQNERLKLKGKPVTAERSDRENSELLGAITTGWTAVYDDDGKKAECTQENATSLYHSETWLRDQVDEFIADNHNFFG